MDIELIDNSPMVKRAFEEACLRALERCGMQAEGYAKDLAPVDTGNLRNSISHRVDEKEKIVYIGTNSEYGAYVELGTGKYYKGGRQDPWVYQDEEGRWHHTNGQRAQPYLKPSVADHKQTYKNIIKDELENA
jgi:HK97 gp10 family phage protein